MANNPTGIYRFHVSVHAQPAGARPGASVRIGGTDYNALEVPREPLGTTTMAGTFEEATERLRRLDRMYCEPDGSFVWVSPQGKPPWQVDGNLYDRAGSLLFVDLKGTCPAEDFDRLLSALGWPAAKLMFQLVREAVFLDEAELRRHALAG